MDYYNYTPKSRAYPHLKFVIKKSKNSKIKVHAMQNYVDNHQIDFHGYHLIENSRFSGKMVGHNKTSKLYIYS